MELHRPAALKGRPAEPYRLLTAAEMMALRPAEWRVKSVLPAEGLASIYGASGTGKSFLALDLALAIAEGREHWFGYRVNQASVLYIPTESRNGISQRLRAWTIRHQREPSNELRVIEDAPFRLNAPGDIARLLESLRELAASPVVIIDTLNRAAPDADENSSIDMGRLIEASSQLQRNTGGLVILVHHAGKDASRGMRGHSSLRGALDAVIEVQREAFEDRRTWFVEKMKDAGDGFGASFFLDTVELGEDDDGDMVESCVLRPDTLTMRAPPRARKLGAHQQIALDTLAPLLKHAHHWGEGGAPMTYPCIRWEDAVDAVGQQLPVEDKRRRERAKGAITNLISGGRMGHGEGWVWLK